MRKGFLLIAASLVCLASFGQKTIEERDFGSVGDTAFMVSDEAYTGSVLTGLSGDLIYWDFSFLADNSRDTILFVNPTSTTDGSVNGSNLVTQETGLLELLNHWNKDANGISITAIGYEFDFSILDTADTVRTVFIEYDNGGIPHASFLMEYQDLNLHFVEGQFAYPIQDTFMFDTIELYVDSVRLIDEVNVTDSINGYGVLYLPGNDTLEGLRQELDIIHNTTLEIKVEIFSGVLIWLPLSDYLDFELPSADEHYVRYWVRGQSYPVLEFTYDTSGTNVESTRYLFSLEEYIDGVDELSNVKQLEVYPNPANDQILIDLGENVFGESQVELLAVTGQVIKKDNVFGDKIQWNIEELEPGVYFVRVTNSNGSRYRSRFIKK